MSFVVHSRLATAISEPPPPSQVGDGCRASKRRRTISGNRETLRLGVLDSIAILGETKVRRIDDGAIFCRATNSQMGPPCPVAGSPEGLTVSEEARRAGPIESIAMSEAQFRQSKRVPADDSA